MVVVILSCFSVIAASEAKRIYFTSDCRSPIKKIEERKIKMVRAQWLPPLPPMRAAAPAPNAGFWDSSSGKAGITYWHSISRFSSFYNCNDWSRSVDNETHDRHGRTVVKNS